MVTVLIIPLVLLTCMKYANCNANNKARLRHLRKVKLKNEQKLSNRGQQKAQAQKDVFLFKVGDEYDTLDQEIMNLEYDIGSEANEPYMQPDFVDSEQDQGDVLHDDPHIKHENTNLTDNSQNKIREARVQELLEFLTSHSKSKKKLTKDV